MSDASKRPTPAELVRMFELSRDLLCIANTDGYFEVVNPAFGRLLGYDDEELLSRRFVEFVHPDDRDQTVERLESIGRGDSVLDFRNRYRARDGSWHWLSWRSAPAEDGVIYAVARDITAAVESERLIERQAEDLARSNSDLEEFAYAASHDLQAPLRALAHLVNWIRDDMPPTPDEKFQRHVDELGIKVERMQALVEDLLAYSRAGRTAAPATDVDTHRLVEETIELLSPPASFRFKLDDSLPKFTAEATPLQQTFRNLIANAVAHHDRDDGKVEIGATDRGDAWEFTVADDGPGIPEHDIERVFLRFVRLDAQSDGTGMGLPLVKKIVERGGGKVGVVSAPGEGTTFSFSWPKTPDRTESR